MATCIGELPGVLPNASRQALGKKALRGASGEVALYTQVAWHDQMQRLFANLG